MDLKTKRKKEYEDEKDKRKEAVISVAIQVFIEKGIENSKMTDIAEKAEIGIASLYRYFKTKTEIVIEAAIAFWDLEIDVFYQHFNENDFKSLNGITRVSKILDVFINIYINHKDFFRFVEEFDNYVVKENIPTERLCIYEKNILNLMPVMIEALELGKKDGSITQNLNNEQYYMTITHTLISLSQKLILRNIILSSDNIIEGKAQLELVKDMALKYIENKNYGGM
jgi:AcrR family transcriptional regulator